MSAAKRAKQDDYSFLPNNVQAIAIQCDLPDSLTTNALYHGQLQPSKLAQIVQEKHNNIHFASVLSQEKRLIYAVAHPTLASQRHLAAILKKLISPNEKRNSSEPNPTIKWTPGLNYWRKRLENVQLHVNLSTHFAGSAPGGAGVSGFRIAASKIRHFCTKFEVKSSVFFFSAFQTFLYKYSHQKMFSIRTFVDNFDNPMCVPCAVSNERTFIDLVRQNRTDFETFASFSDVPLQLIECEILQNKNNNVLFNFDNFRHSPDKFDVCWHNSDINATLALDIQEKSREFRATFHYDNKLLGRHKIDKMAAHFRTILVDCIDNPQYKVSNYSLVSAQDENLFRKWNQTQQEVDFDVTIHEMFDNQVGKCGTKMAVICDDESITYSELDRRINLFRTYLGVESGSVVGVCLEKCIDLVAIFVAILKTGSSYVAIDPSYPAERIKLLIENSGAKSVVTTGKLTNKLPRTIPVLLVEKFDPQLHEQQTSGTHYAVTSSAPAYVIYTSGTTGKPKGVTATHRNVVCLVTGMISVFKSSQTSGILLSASPSFCLFHGLLYYALAHGSTAILAPSLLHLPKIKHKEQITFIATPPAGFRRLMADQSLPRSLRTVVFGGDFIPRDLVTDLQSSRPEINVFICHGCTEATLFALSTPVPQIGPPELSAGAPVPQNMSAWAPVPQNVSAGAPVPQNVSPGAPVPQNVSPGAPVPQIMSAGAPVPNMKVYILDKDLCKVPIGFVGELCLSGPQVADGYLKLESRDKFVENPFESNGFYVKMYRTGDLARWTDNGQVEIVGRINSMVKINGIRIELDEIANVLRRHDAILDVVVSAAEVGNSKLLVAYCVTKTIESFDEIKEYLMSNLPRYMVPQLYVKMEELPRNLNGKIARHLLPPPPPSGGSGDNNETELNDTEIQVLGVIRRLFSKTISLNDNLLENGLDSILATQLVIELEEMFKIKIPVSLVYETKTPAGICKRIDCAQNDADVQIPLDLTAAAILRDDVTAEAAYSVDINIKAANPNYILLTGATGFVGAFILTELLTTTNAYIYCLVRAENPTEANLRVRQNLEFYKLWRSEYESKLTALQGDVTKPKLGMAAHEYETMTSVIDTIYHAAATVNFLLPFSAIKNGVDEILKFAMAVKIKPFHYISSIAVHGNKNKRFPVSRAFEDTDLNTSVNLIPQIGYAQMKWVSEKLVRLAAARGLPVTIFRPSYVSGHSQTGSVSVHEFVTRLIKDCVRVKCYPDVGVRSQLVPVDFVSRSVVKISLDAGNFGKVFHLTPCWTSDVTVRELMGYVGRCGFEMQGVECGKWLEMLRANADGDWALYPLVDFVAGYLSSGNDFWEFDASNVESVLGHAQMGTREIGFNCVKVMIDFLIERRFIK